MSAKTWGMQSQSLQQIDPCFDCQIRKAAEEEMMQTKDVVQPKLADYRYACANCQNIYKFDLLMQYWKAQKKPTLPPGKGKRCIIPSSIQQKVMEYHQKGMSQQKIADMMGLSRQHVQRIIVRLTSLTNINGAEMSDG